MRRLPHDNPRGIRVDEEGAGSSNSPTTWSTSGTSRSAAGAAESGARTRAVALLPENFHAELIAATPAATKKPIVGVGRFTNPDTMAEVDQRRAARRHRSGAALDRRPLPAEQDRGGPARRDPRVHRLQRLRLAGATRAAPIVCTQNATSGEEYRRGWHPELFTRPRTPTTTSSSSAPARPGWSARSSSASAACGESTWSKPRIIGEPCAGSPHFPGSGSGHGVINYRQIQLDKLRNVEVHPRERLSSAGHQRIRRGDRRPCHWLHTGSRRRVEQPDARSDPRCGRRQPNQSSRPSRCWRSARLAREDRCPLGLRGQAFRWAWPRRAP